MKLAKIVFFLSPLLFGVGVAMAVPIVLNQSLGFVGEKVVTQRGVIASKATDQFWQSTKSLNLEVSSQDVTAVIVEKVVALEAAGFDFGGISPAEVKVEKQKLISYFNSQVKLKALEMSDSELESLVVEKLTYKAFLEFKTNSLKSTVSDVEAKAYFEKNRYKFGNVAFESYKSQVVSFLEQQQLQERMRSWFEILKRKYKVRNLMAK